MIEIDQSSFLSICNVWCHYAQKLSAVTEPLGRLLTKVIAASFLCKKRMRCSYDLLKEASIDPLAVQSSCNSSPLSVETDASSRPSLVLYREGKG